MASRSQIRLDPEVLRRAREKAASLGVSFAEYVRRLVLRDLERPRSPADVSLVFDLADSGGSEVARRKDEYVDEAVEAEHRKEKARRRRR